MCHTGSQEYTDGQFDSLSRLVVYLQGHYHVLDQNIITHKYAQQGDHTDPVNFAWDRFIADKVCIAKRGVEVKIAKLANESTNWQTAALPVPVIEPNHQPVRLVPVDSNVSNVSSQIKPNNLEAVVPSVAPTFSRANASVPITPANTSAVIQAVTPVAPVTPVVTQPLLRHLIPV